MGCTIKEIAARCGVSEGTIDRALNNRKGISEKTKEKILNTAKELNYSPNHMARCLATGSTKTIGVITSGIANEFLATMIEAIERSAAENGYFITLVLTRNDVQKEIDGIRYMAERKVDGLIIFPVGQGKEHVELLKNLNVPVVSIYNRIGCEFTHVDVDCRLIMRTAVEKIASKGYSRIIYMDLGIDKLRRQGVNVFSLDERRKGVEEGIKKTGLEAVYLKSLCNHTEEFVNLISESKKTLVLCSFDGLAIKVLNICRNHNIRVPEDLGIMGFDNIDILDSISPRINSIDCDSRNIGRTAFSVLLEKINNEYTGGDLVLDYAFTKGETL